SAPGAARATYLNSADQREGGAIMIELLDVSYVRLGTRDLEGATRFAVDYLGLEISKHEKAAVCFKSDAREHTLCYFEGNPADQAVAFEVRDKEELDAAASEL